MLWKLMNFVIANVVNDKPTLKTWEETTVILLQNIQKLIKRFFQIFGQDCIGKKEKTFEVLKMFQINALQLLQLN